MEICEASVEGKAFKTEMPLVVNEGTNNSSSVAVSSVPMVESGPQYLPLNSFAGNAGNASNADHSSQLSVMGPMPTLNAIDGMACETLLQPMPSTQMTTISSSANLPLVSASTPVQTATSKTITTQESDAMKAIIAQNPVLTSTASTTPVTTQANNISALSEMTDAELLRFINPETFDQSMIQNIVWNAWQLIRYSISFPFLV